LVHIKRITIQGFKSFGPKRNTIKLEKGFVVITGPNGGGKSNVLDAIKFCLGELSNNALRVSKLSDLIHESGGRKLSTATVTLVLDNTDKSLPIDSEDVSISRTIVSSGESTYRINGRAVSRNDLLSLLAAANIRPSGFNIITQGAVLSIAEKSPEDLRKMIEEVAGTAEYDKKRAEAMRELEIAEKNVAVAKAGVTELRSRVKQLELERSQLVRSILIQRYLEQLSREQLEAELSATEQSIVEAHKELGMVEEKIGRLRAVLDQLSLERTKLVRDVERVEQDIAAAQSEMTDLQTKATRFSREMESLKGAIIREGFLYSNNRRRILLLQLRKFQLEQSLIQLKEGYSMLEREYSDSQDQLRVVEERLQRLLNIRDTILTKLNETRAGREERVKRRLELLKSLSETEASISALENRLQDLENRRSQLMKRLSKQEEIIAQGQHSLKELRDKYQRLVYVQAKIEEERGALRDKLSLTERLRSECDSLINEASRLKGEIEGEISRLGWAPKESRDKQPWRDQGVRMLGDLLEDLSKVPNALLPILSRHRDTLVVEKESFAAALALRAAEIGKDLSVVAIGGEGLDKKHAPACLACTIAGEGEELRRALHAIFPDHYITDRVFEPGKPAFSTDGIYSSGRGYYRALKEAVNLNRLSTAMVEVDRIISAAELIRSHLEGSIAVLKERAKEAEEKLVSAKSEAGQLEAEINSLERKIEETRREAEEIRGEMDATINDSNTISAEKEKLAEKLGKIRSELEGLSQVKGDEEEILLERRLAELNEEARALEREIGSRSASTRTTKQQMEQAWLRIQTVEQELSKIETEIETLEVACRESKLRLRRLADDYKNVTSRLNDLRRRLEELSSAVQRSQALRVELRSRLAELEDALNNKRSDASVLDSERNRIQIRIVELRMRETGIKEKLEAFRSPQTRDLELLPAEFKKRLRSELEGELSSIGMVNQLSLEQYPQLAAEYISRSKNLQILDQERRKILEIIKMIDDKKLEAFMRTVELVSSGFSRFFSALTGGSAWLELSDPARPLESGVELITAFPGKAARSSKSVSGGEKSIAAVSLLLAFQGLTPAEFLILDEIDAHMDANYSKKLAELLKEFSNRSQVIAVSLKDIVAEKADQLIGVYNQGGESRVVYTKLEEN
jgi:chromosome segregation protein